MAVPVVAMVVVALVIEVTAALRTRAVAEGAADLAALAAAAASTAPEGRSPVAAATAVAAANDVTFVACQCLHLPMTVTVQVTHTSVLGLGDRTIRASADATLVPNR